LRKNLKTGRFELYRHYYTDGYDEVIFTGSLEECLRKAEEWKRFHFGWAGVVPEFKACRHRPPDISSLCPKRRVVCGGLWSGNLGRLFRLSEPPQICFQPFYPPEFGFVEVCGDGLE